jgi:acetolactate synthase-1/2/3 large subunit
VSDDRINGLAELLVGRGLRYAFGVAGSGDSMKLIVELGKLGATYHPVAHEASGAIMAGAVARVTGRPSVCISIKGPGLVSMVPGVAFNQFENSPALSVSESFGPQVPGHRRHKRLDHPDILRTLVKGVSGLKDDVSLAGQLLDVAFAETPGPVHIELGGSVSGNYELRVLRPRRKDPHDSESLERICNQIRRSARPAVIVGSLASRRNWGGRLAGLKVPVFNTAAAKGVVDERAEFSAGVFTGAGAELSPESVVLPSADLVIGIGLRNTEVLKADSLPKLPKLKEGIALLDEVDDGLSDGFGGVLALAGEPGMSRVLDELDGHVWGATDISGALALLRSILSDGWVPGTCFDVLNGLDWDHGLALDTGSFCTVGEHMWFASAARPFWGSSNGRFMGASLPFAIGAAIARPGLPVFCVVGDGGVRPYFAEIGLAVDESLPVCFLLMSDGRYGSVVGTPGKGGHTERAVNISRPSWWKSVQAMGCASAEIASAADLRSALGAWDRSGPLFLEARFEAQAYGAMTERIRS